MRRSVEDTEAAPALWRPWLPAGEDEQVVEAVRPEEVPDLPASIGAGGLAEALMPAVVEYEDPTVDDELEPMREFEIVRLEPPAFELSIPRLRPITAIAPDRPAAGPEELPPPAPADERATRAPEGPAAADRSGPADAAGAADPARRARCLERLAQIRGEETPQNGRPRPRGSREELVQRLVDPTLTLEETALLLGVCPTTVRRYTNRGHLKHFRTRGNQRRFRFSDVLEFLDARGSEVEADARAERGDA